MMNNHMAEFDLDRQNRQFGSFSMSTVFDLIRAAGAMMGLATLLLGLYCAGQTFSLIITSIESPAVFETSLGKWVTAVGGDKLNIAFPQGTFHAAYVLAVFIISGAAFLISWLSISLIGTGCRVLGSILGEEGAIKRILEHVFGPGKTVDPKKVAEIQGS
jgi:hypothetical protein